MQTAARATYGQDLIAALETSTGIVGLLDANEPRLARVAARAYTLDDLERSSTSQREAKEDKSSTNSLLARHDSLGSRQTLPRYHQVDGTSPCQSVSTTKRSQLVRDETRRRELPSRKLSLQKLSIGIESL